MFTTQSTCTIEGLSLKIKEYLLPVQRLINQLPLKPVDKSNRPTSTEGKYRNTKPAMQYPKTPPQAGQCEKLPCARIQVQGFLWAADEGLHLLARGKPSTHGHDTNTSNYRHFLQHNTLHWRDRPLVPLKPEKSQQVVSKHLHDPVDELSVLLWNVCRAFGRGWRDEGRRPDAIGVLIPPLFCLLSQLGFLLLVQVWDSSSGQTNTVTYI